MAKEALTDTLKYVFNMLLQYPRITQADKLEQQEPGKKPVMGELWDEKFAPYAFLPFDRKRRLTFL